MAAPAPAGKGQASQAGHVRAPAWSRRRGVVLAVALLRSPAGLERSSLAGRVRRADGPGSVRGVLLLRPAGRVVHPSPGALTAAVEIQIRVADGGALSVLEPASAATGAALEPASVRQAAAAASVAAFEAEVDAQLRHWSLYGEGASWPLAGASAGVYAMAALEAERRLLARAG